VRDAKQDSIFLNSKVFFGRKRRFLFELPVSTVKKTNVNGSDKLDCLLLSMTDMQLIQPHASVPFFPEWDQQPF